MFLQVSVYPVIRIVIGTIFTTLSIIIILSEVLSMWDQRFHDIMKGFITGAHSGLWFGMFMVLWVYAIMLIHYSIFSVRIEGFYGLYVDHQSDVSS
jgi:hypothetical protein